MSTKIDHPRDFADAASEVLGLSPCPSAILQAIDSAYGPALRNRVKVLLRSPSDQRVFLSSIEHKRFNNNVFNNEAIDLIVSGNIWKKSTRISRPMRLYCIALLLHAYVTGSHWNSANHEDMNALLGCFVEDSTRANRATVIAACQFLLWLGSQKCGAIDVEFVAAGIAVLMLRQLAFVADVAVRTIEWKQSRTPHRFRAERRAASALIACDVFEMNQDGSDAWCRCVAMSNADTAIVNRCLALMNCNTQLNGRRSVK